jgi:hypothetical protein
MAATKCFESQTKDAILIPNMAKNIDLRAAKSFFQEKKAILAKSVGAIIAGGKNYATLH